MVIFGVGHHVSEHHGRSGNIPSGVSDQERRTPRPTTFDDEENDVCALGWRAAAAARRPGPAAGSTFSRSWQASRRRSSAPAPRPSRVACSRGSSVAA